MNPELARTPEELAKGLQFRDKPPKGGMLLCFDKPQKVSIHMHNVKFPLDLTFMDKFHMPIKTVKNAQPETDGYECDNCQYVLETASKGNSATLDVFKSSNKEVLLRFKNFAFSKGYKEKIVGDDAYAKTRSPQSPMIKLISAKEGKMLVFETGKGRYYLEEKTASGVNKEFVKDFAFAYKRNAGGKKEILSLTDPVEVKKRLDFVVNNNFRTFKSYHQNATMNDYKNFWTDYLKDEIGYYKKLISKTASKISNVTELLKLYANKYKSLDDLYLFAKDNLLRENEGKNEFIKLINNWVAKRLQDKKEKFYVELPFGSHKLIGTLPNGKKFDLIKIAQRGMPEDVQHAKLKGWEQAQIMDPNKRDWIDDEAELGIYGISEKQLKNLLGQEPTEDEAEDIDPADLGVDMSLAGVRLDSTQKYLPADQKLYNKMYWTEKRMTHIIDKVLKEAGIKRRKSNENKS